MAQDLRLDHSAGPTFSSDDGFNSTISAGGASDSDSVDLGAQSPVDLGIELTLVTGAGAIDGTYVLRVRWSQDDTNFTDVERAPVVFAFTPDTTSHTHYMSTSIPVRARYVRFRHENNGSSTMSFTTGSSLVLHDIAIDIA